MNRRSIPLLIPGLGQLALHYLHSCNSISQDVEVLLNSTRVIKIPGKLINAELTPPSMLIGGEVSGTQRPMAVVKPLAGGCGRSNIILALHMD